MFQTALGQNGLHVKEVKYSCACSSCDKSPVWNQPPHHCALLQRLYETSLRGSCTPPCFSSWPETDTEQHYSYGNVQLCPCILPWHVTGDLPNSSAFHIQFPYQMVYLLQQMTLNLKHHQIMHSRSLYGSLTLIIVQLNLYKCCHETLKSMLSSKKEVPILGQNSLHCGLPCPALFQGR